MRLYGLYRFCALAGLIILTLGCVTEHTDLSTPKPTSQPTTSSHNTHRNPNDYYDPEAALWPFAWVPPKILEDKTRWQGIIIHHSAQNSGNAADMDQAHRLRGWDGLGYHFVIDNGQGGYDGTIEVGFRWKRQEKGAHCRPDNNDDNYWNEHTIGICLVGDLQENYPTSTQWQSLLKLVRFLQARYQIPADCIIGHRDVPGSKTKCPGRYVSLDRLRQDLANDSDR